VINLLAERHGLAFTRQQANALITSGNVAGESVVLAKPQNYMNRSGGPVNSLCRFYKIELSQLIVVYDDLDLPPGTIRLKPSGGAGGQNGMKDIIQKLGSDDFARLRVGIGRPPGRMPPPKYVLQDFSAEQQEVMSEAYERAVEALETWLKDGLELAMSRHNGPSRIDEHGN
jgi:PTH1 family peptidyl-tRNA hydrolase